MAVTERKYAVRGLRRPRGERGGTMSISISGQRLRQFERSLEQLATTGQRSRSEAVVELVIGEAERRGLVPREAV